MDGCWVGTGGYLVGAKRWVGAGWGLVDIWWVLRGGVLGGDWWISVGDKGEWVLGGDWWISGG